ncbi:MAG: elongation factor G [Thermoanaerobaculia bacterium]|nr:elongation factor G [Thermoanaerobaculia bacterium]
MLVDSPEKIRNLALVGHNDTGKTTLASALLLTGGVVNRLGRVEDGNATTDFDAEETARGISLGIGTCFVPWRGHKVNIVDTPGYGIFHAEMRAGLRAVDAALLCVNSVAGVEVNAEKAWEIAAEFELPVLVHLTKMDRERADLERALDSLQASFGRQVLPIQLPIGREQDFSGIVDLLSGQAHRFERDGNGKGSSGPVPPELEAEVTLWRNRLVEAVAEADEALLEKFFEEGTLSEEELRHGLRTAVARRQLFPVTLGAHSHGIGNSTLLEVLLEVAPPPSSRSHPATARDGASAAVACDPAAPVAAVVFKTLNDPFTGKISILRVLSGTLDSDTQLVNARSEELERVNGLLALQGKQGSSVPKLVAGDIGAVAKLKSTRTGDSLVAKDRFLRLAWPPVPDGAMSFAIEPKAKGDEEKIGDALARLIEEDPSLHAGRDPQTGEFLLSGTAQLHVEIAVSRLKRRSNVEVVLHPPRVPYRETILRAADGHGRHKKQTGGRGQFADCKIKIEPLERGLDFEFVDEIFGGAIPQNFRPAVEKGIQEARVRGFLSGNPMVDFRVKLIDGQFHDVDSSELAFKIAGSLAYKDAMEKASPTILEPIMKVEVITGEEFMGDIMSDLSQRRGRPQGMDTRGHQQVVKALVPMAEMLNYAAALRAMTQGRSDFHMEFSHYEEAPRHVQEKIIAEAARLKKEEAEA